MSSVNPFIRYKDMGVYILSADIAKNRHLVDFEYVRAINVSGECEEMLSARIAYYSNCFSIFCGIPSVTSNFITIRKSCCVQARAKKMKSMLRLLDVYLFVKFCSLKNHSFVPIPDDIVKRALRIIYPLKFYSTRFII